MTYDKSQLLKVVGWTSIAAGAYMLYLSGMYDDTVTTILSDSDVIDAEWYEVE